MRRLLTTAATGTLATAFLIPLAAPASAADVALDAGLRACVNASLGQAPDAPVTTEQAASVVTLTCGDRGIVDLTGIDAFTSLASLILRSNSIVDLTPLTDLPLIHLNLNDNPALDLASMPNLPTMTQLSIERTNTVDLAPVAHMTRLEILNIDGNPIADLGPIMGMDELNTLYASSAEIEDLTPVADLSSLEYLNVHDNDISDLGPLASMTGLAWIGAGYNHIVDVSVLAGLPDAGTWLEDQSIRLEDIEIDTVQGNPLRDVDGRMIAPVSETAVVAADGASWTFSEAGDHTLDWSLDEAAFSGRISQTAFVVPVDPVDPPVEPVDPTDPPVEPVDPTDPPVEPVVPTDPPVEPVDPTDPPVEPVVPPVDSADAPVDSAPAGNGAAVASGTALARTGAEHLVPLAVTAGLVTLVGAILVARRRGMRTD